MQHRYMFEKMGNVTQGNMGIILASAAILNKLTNQWDFNSEANLSKHPAGRERAGTQDRVSFITNTMKLPSSNQSAHDWTNKYRDADYGTVKGQAEPVIKLINRFLEVSMCFTFDHIVQKSASFLLGWNKEKHDFIHIRSHRSSSDQMQFQKKHDMSK